MRQIYGMFLLCNTSSILLSQLLKIQNECTKIQTNNSKNNLTSTEGECNEMVTSIFLFVCLICTKKINLVPIVYIS